MSALVEVSANIKPDELPEDWCFEQNCPEFAARMERSLIEDNPSPDCAAVHPGYKADTAS
jgi:hypothetical protein